MESRLQTQIEHRLKSLNTNCTKLVAKVILAVDAGSCAWGLNSEQSDHDIRFIYISPLPCYLSIDSQRQRDTLVFKGEKMDFSGWDLRKALKLCRESNPDLLDWLRTSKVLQKEEKLVTRLWQLAMEIHCPKALTVHWLHTANKHDKLFFGERKEVILKKYFYVIRPLLCIEWIRLKYVNHDCIQQELPPIILKELISGLAQENCFLPLNLGDEILRLIEKKTTGNMGVGTRIPALDNWIAKCWDFYGNFCERLDQKKQNQQSFLSLDIFFQETVREYLVVPVFHDE